MKFIAIDVETANADFSSICQIGIVIFENGIIIEEWESLIDPEDDFDHINMSIHGIDEEKVKGQPKFKEIYFPIKQKLENNIVVCHMPFDRVALRQAAGKYGLPLLSCTWLDSARIARRAWEKFAYSGYGLKNVASELGIQFEHHKALEDAKVAGLILLKAIETTSIGLDEWLIRVERPLFPNKSQRIQFDGNPDGHLYGETIVFTGELNLSRGEASVLAAKAGCKVDPSVTKRTTLLIVGDQDARKLKGQEKSSKHRKVEELIRKGQKIRILTERDFIKLVGI